MLLNATEFNREVARERIRATRRSFPFCMIVIELKGSEQLRRRNHMMVRLLHRHLRMTDHKGILGQGKYGILLVDTPEMGGRSALDRLTQLTNRHGLHVTMDLRVHDPSGFRPEDDDDDDDSGTGLRRRDDEVTAKWIRVDGQVDVTTEDPLVPRPLMRMVAKRSLDILGASAGLVMTGPIIAWAMWRIRKHDSAPAVFKQTREGLRGKPFTIYKLRTMCVDAESSQAALRSHSHRDGPAFKIENDPRVTPIGDFLRKTCIDELPQLWNVLKGDMSLVGPRPLPWHESRACGSWQRRRLDVRPGMTCYWQVDKKSVESFDDWMRLDLRYIDEIGIFRDLGLIAKTVVVPMSGRGSE
ncbi:MAG: sugar transferase [Rubripirellula sp.]